MTDREETIDETSIRSRTYEMLSAAFSIPDDNVGILFNALVCLLPIYQKPMEPSSRDESRDAESTLDESQLQREYNRLFVGPGHIPCPPYESVYRKDRPETELGLLMAPSVIDVKRRYDEAGLTISKGFNDLPDHVAVELEFMHFLCAMELESKDNNANLDMWKKRQREFVDLHLKPWIGAFADLTMMNTSSTFYRIATSLLNEFVSYEAEYLSVSQN